MEQKKNEVEEKSLSKFRAQSIISRITRDKSEDKSHLQSFASPYLPLFGSIVTATLVQSLILYPFERMKIILQVTP